MRFDKVPFLNEYPEVRQKLLAKDKGYDGQFFFFMSFDPFLSRYKDQPAKYKQVVDSPQYRYGRILFAALTNFVSLNHPEYFAKTMIFLILASHLIGAYFFLKIVRFYQSSDLWIFCYLLIPGFIVSMNLALPESLAAAFLLGGIYFYLKQRLFFASLFFSLSILTRETAILFVLVLALFDFYKARSFKRCALIVCSIVPYFLWRCFLTWRLFSAYGWDTLFHNVGDFAYPFEGVILNYRKASLGIKNQALIVYSILMSINLCLTFIFLWMKRNAFTVSALLYSFMNFSLSYEKVWHAIRSVERTTYEGFLFLILAYLSLRSEKQLPMRLAFVFGIYCILLLSYNLFLCSFATSYRAGFQIWRPLFNIF